MDKNYSIGVKRQKQLTEKKPLSHSENCIFLIKIVNIHCKRTNLRCVIIGAPWWISHNFGALLA